MEIRAARANAKECIYLSQTEPELYVGPGSGLSLSKCFRAISGLHAQVSYTIRSTIFFFLEVHLFCLLR